VTAKDIVIYRKPSKAGKSGDADKEFTRLEQNDVEKVLQESQRKRGPAFFGSSFGFSSTGGEWLVYKKSSFAKDPPDTISFSSL
jgi:hypothetical protein